MGTDNKPVFEQNVNVDQIEYPNTYYSYAMFDQIQYTNYLDLIIQII